MEPMLGKCPSCDKTGEVGQPCDERACVKRGHHMIPVEFWEKAHESGAPDPMIGVLVGDFLITDVIGAGGFGKVYLALQAPMLELKGALKIIEYETLDEIEEVLLDKFKVEAQTLAQINHPNIVRLLKYGNHGQRPYLVMEYLGGGLTLQDEMLRRYEDKVALDREFVLGVLDQILNGLEHMHERGIIHRDIKPENIMLQSMAGNPFHVRLLDFGLAKFVERGDKTQLPMGTPMYMAPEQLYMSNLGPWTDLYAVAGMACWLTTGLRPFPGDSKSQIIPKKLKKGYDPSARLAEAGVHKQVVSFFHDALHYDPEQRIRTTAEFRERLHALFFSEQQATHAAPVPTQHPTMALESGDLDVLVAAADSDAPPPAPNTPPENTPSEDPSHDAPTRHAPEVPPTRTERPSSEATSIEKPPPKTFPLGRAALGAGLAIGLGVAAVMAWPDPPKPKPKPPVAKTPQAPAFDKQALIQRVETLQRASNSVDAAVTSALGESTKRAELLKGALIETRAAFHDAWEAAAQGANTPSVVNVSAGKFHTCALLWDGGVRCWGDNKHGELGLGTRKGLKAKQKPYQSPRVVLGGPAFALVSAGDRRTGHNCVLDGASKVRCWGSNKYGQLGYGHTDTIGDDETPADAGPVPLGDIKLTSISAGSAQYSGHTCALSDAGKIWCWGRNNYGQLGYGHTDTIGDDETPESVGPISLGRRKAKAVASGKYHSCAILTNGRARCWGRNNMGQLGQGNTDQVGDDEGAVKARTVRVKGGVAELALGREHTCAMNKTGDVFCWGSQERGQLGTGVSGNLGDDESVQKLAPVAIGFDAVQIVAGELHTCALSGEGKVRCWGDNKFGQLGATHTRTVGDDETPETQADIAIGGEVVRLGAGSYHTCALLTSGNVRCWGANTKGQLGYGHKDRIGDSETPSHAGDIAIFDPSNKKL